VAFLAVFLTFALPLQDAEAKRFGGGRSFGMQRPAPMNRNVAPNQAQNPPSQAPGNLAQPGKRSWMGPLAGLAAGLGLAALASHFGFGAGMANFLMIALLAMAAFMLLRWFMSRGQQPAPRPMQYAGAEYAGSSNAGQPLPFPATQPLSGGAGGIGDTAPAYPPGFDAVAFARQAKVNFLRLQAANDACNLDDIREFTSPEMYAEIKLDMDDRHGAVQRTEVVTLEAEVLEAVEDGNRHIASVRFHGMLREDSEQAAAFDEIWNLSRQADGNHGWVVAGIQQNG
jgi:predicted lipid-binding transport protein (Tim44 family)